MNLQQLRYAKAVAECGSFVRAASLCAVTQPTLSNGVAQLEDELGHLLFSRTTRSVRLTEAGALLLPNIVDILSAQATLVAHARMLANPQRRLIRVGVSPVIGVKFMDVVLESFRSANRDMEIVFRELNLAEMLALLAADQLDFVFGPVDATPPSELRGLASVAFYEEPLMFVASSKTEAAYRGAKSVTLKDIAREMFVTVPDTCGLTRTTRALFRRNRLKLAEYGGQAMSYSVLQEWAELGIGSAILPRSKLPASAHFALPIRGGKATAGIHHRGLWKAGANLSPQVKQLSNFLKHAAPAIVQGLAQ